MAGLTVTIDATNWADVVIAQWPPMKCLPDGTFYIDEDATPLDCKDCGCSFPTYDTFGGFCRECLAEKRARNQRK